jgi:hypothetical protein
MIVCEALTVLKCLCNSPHPASFLKVAGDHRVSDPLAISLARYSDSRQNALRQIAKQYQKSGSEKQEYSELTVASSVTDTCSTSWFSNWVDKAEVALFGDRRYPPHAASI